MTKYVVKIRCPAVYVVYVEASSVADAVNKATCRPLQWPHELEDFDDMDIEVLEDAKEVEA